MTEPDGYWPYWGIHLPGMSETEAERLLAFAEDAGISRAGEAIDPRLFHTVICGRHTTCSMIRVLKAVQSDPQSLDEDALEAVETELYAMQEWLKQAAPEDEDEV